jgi:membrane-bound lytic murein transglycosylase MltF
MNFVPIIEDSLDLELDAESIEQYQARLLALERVNRQRLLLAQRQRRRQAMDKDSSDSEVEDLSKGVKAGKMDVTPAESTPAETELVKLDP